jgi:hypothetical protein
MKNFRLYKSISALISRQFKEHHTGALGAALLME